eukprot:617980-Hanusia_phi.AAC.1
MIGPYREPRRRRSDRTVTVRPWHKSRSRVLPKFVAESSVPSPCRWHLNRAAAEPRTGVLGRRTG